MAAGDSGRSRGLIGSCGLIGQSRAGMGPSVGLKVSGGLGQALGGAVTGAEADLSSSGLAGLDM